MKRRDLFKLSTGALALFSLKTSMFAAFQPPRALYVGQRLSLQLEKIRPYLPSGVSLYNVGGQTVFPIYGASGGLAAAMCAYFIGHTENQSWASGMMFGYMDDDATIERKIKEALKNFEPVNMNGGPLPAPRFADLKHA